MMHEGYDWSAVRGFNYQPSYGSTSFENWRYYDPCTAELELRRGKEYFPKFNVVRYWLSWDAYVRDPKKFAADFETSLRIADRLGLKVIACLFNRWHNDFVDCGGVYLDQIIPGSNWAYREHFYRDYFEDIVKPHRDDERVLVWDICNEPFSYYKSLKEMGEIVTYEKAWLTEMYEFLKDMDVRQPLAVSPHNGTDGPAPMLTFELSDVLFLHPYYVGEQEDAEKKKRYEAELDFFVEQAKQAGKPGIVATECCWGSLDDGWRVQNIRYTCGELAKRGIGIVPHALHHSLVADLHLPEYGPVGPPGDLRFINADGTLRAGHEVFNEY